MKEEDICLHTVTYVHWMYLFYTSTAVLSAHSLSIQAHIKLLGVEEQGQMSRRDRNCWSYGMCSYPSFTPAAAKNSLSYGYQARFSEEVFNLLSNQKFLCCCIQKQILRATFLNSEKKNSKYLHHQLSPTVRADKILKKKSKIKCKNGCFVVFLTTIFKGLNRGKCFDNQKKIEKWPHFDYCFTWKMLSSYNLAHSSFSATCRERMSYC